MHAVVKRGAVKSNKVGHSLVPLQRQQARSLKVPACCKREAQHRPIARGGEGQWETHCARRLPPGLPPCAPLPAGVWKWREQQALSLFRTLCPQACTGDPRDTRFGKSKAPQQACESSVVQHVVQHCFKRSTVGGTPSHPSKQSQAQRSPATHRGSAGHRGGRRLQRSRLLYLLPALLSLLHHLQGRGRGRGTVVGTRQLQDA